MRKVIQHTIKAEGRDHGKVYEITEMSAAKGEAWALRIFMALLQGNVDIPPGLLSNLGVAALAEFGMRALTALKWDILEPLLKEMFDTVRIIPDPKQPLVIRPLIEAADDIEEIPTRIDLRVQIWNLNMGFLKAALEYLKPGIEAVESRKRHTHTEA